MTRNEYSRRDFLSPFNYEPKKKPEIKKSEQLTQLIKEISDSYQIDIKIESEVDHDNVYEKLIDVQTELKKYPYNFFINLAKLRNSLLNIDQENSDPKKLSLIFENYPIDSRSAGSSRFSKQHFYIKFNTSLNMNNVKRIIHHEIGHLTQNALKNISSTTYNPNDVFFNTKLRNIDYNSEKQSQRLSTCSTKYPGFTTDYSLTSNQEYFAEEFGKLFNYPETTLGNYYNYSSPEKVANITSIIQMCSIVSGGLMGKQFFRDLHEDKVSQNYWESRTQQETDFLHIDQGSLSVFSIDLNPLSKEYFPASVTVKTEPFIKNPNEKLADKTLLTPKTKIDLGNDTNSYLKIEQNFEQVVVEIQGIELSFFTLSKDSQANITILTHEDEITFTVIRDNDENLFLKDYSKKKRKIQINAQNKKRLTGLLFFSSLAASGFSIKTARLADKEFMEIRRKGASKNKYKTTRRKFMIGLVGTVGTIFTDYYFSKKFFETNKPVTHSQVQKWYKRTQNELNPFTYNCETIDSKIAVYPVYLLELKEENHKKFTQTNSLQNIEVKNSNKDVSFMLDNERYIFSKKQSYFILESEQHLIETEEFSKIITMSIQDVGRLVNMHNQALENNTPTSDNNIKVSVLPNLPDDMQFTIKKRGNHSFKQLHVLIKQPHNHINNTLKTETTDYSGKKVEKLFEVYD